MARGKAQGAAKKATGATKKAALAQETTARVEVEETPEVPSARETTATSPDEGATQQFPTLETKEPRKRGAYFAI